MSAAWGSITVVAATVACLGVRASHPAALLDLPVLPRSHPQPSLAAVRTTPPGTTATHHGSDGTHRR